MLGHGTTNQPSLDDLGPDALRIDTPPVVPERDLKHARAVAGVEADLAGAGFAGPSAFLGRLDAVIQRGRPSGLEAVIVAGEVILKDGRFTRVDKGAALKELAAALSAPLRPDELRRRELARAVLPYVKSFYDGWLDHSASDPFYRQNSRRLCCVRPLSLLSAGPATAAAFQPGRAYCLRLVRSPNDASN